MGYAKLQTLLRDYPQEAPLRIQVKGMRVNAGKNRNVYVA